MWPSEVVSTPEKVSPKSWSSSMTCSPCGSSNNNNKNDNNDNDKNDDDDNNNDDDN